MCCLSSISSRLSALCATSFAPYPRRAVSPTSSMLLCVTFLFQRDLVQVLRTTLSKVANVFL